MERIPHLRQILIQFQPWGRIEKDGTFAELIARARYDVLGGEGYGFWSEPSDLNRSLAFVEANAETRQQPEDICGSVPDPPSLSQVLVGHESSLK